ncbi:DUF5074 domain-containing protein [Chitinophaga alhagiae]|uniref:DUF5074 domain-containing protein n=1 Tax=Chitinophaga alhagiae TaxID=2203219 RepID=UPI000E5C0830|nr:DUF5074 domain-containing protein [Chitinophaga alhagiae]
MKKHLRLLAGLALLAFMAACSRNNGPVFQRPVISAAKTTDSLRIGQTLRLSPQLSQPLGAAFQWSVNGAPVGTDSVYTFEAKESGSYRITFRMSNAAGIDSLTYNIKVWGRYENGFFVLNEGWFGTETGSVHFYEYGTDTVRTWVYKHENPGKTLGGVMNTLQYGAVYNGKLYMVVKAGGPLVVADALTLKETGRIDKPAGGDAMTFVGIDNTRGLLSAGDGIYPLNLNTLGLGAKLGGITGTVGNMLKAGDYVFVHSAKDGMVVLDAVTFGVVQVPTKATIGFVQAKNGDVYAAKDSMLMSINPATLKLDSVKMPFKAAAPWGAWRSVSMAASAKEDNVYIIEPGKNWSYGTKLYRYAVGNAASLNEPFITLPDGQYFYGAGVAYDARTNELVITTINGPYSGSVNRVLFYNAATGALNKTVVYEGWYFPAMTVFHQ